jgi:hypothetical protein
MIYNNLNQKKKSFKDGRINFFDIKKSCIIRGIRQLSNLQLPF